MKKILIILLVGFAFFVLNSTESFAVKGQNPFSNNAGSSSTKVRTDSNSQIKNIDIIKDTNKPTTNNKNANCKDNTSKKGVCSPNSFGF